MSEARLFCLIVLLPVVPAFLLFKALSSTGDVRGTLLGLPIQLSGAFAGYFALVALILVSHKILIPPMPPPQQIKVWTVKGTVLENGTPVQPLRNCSFLLNPNPVKLDPFGNFELQFVSMPNPDSQSGFDYPTLTIIDGGYQSAHSMDPSQLSSTPTASGGTINLGTVNLNPPATYSPASMTPTIPNAGASPVISPDLGGGASSGGK